MLQAASRALGERGGTLVVVDPVLPDDELGHWRGAGAQHAYLEDLGLMVVGGGRDRTLREWRALFERAELNLTGTHLAPPGAHSSTTSSTLCGLVGVLVLRKPPTRPRSEGVKG